ncbi:MAG TPA: metal ABC transporter ATP-binding protein [Kofleriaceae bacterium]
MPPLLLVENLQIAFGDVAVVRDLSFHVDRGESLAVIGPNGCGKTVLFKALVGSIPFRGRIEWSPGVRIGYVPQKLDLERDLPITGHDLLVAKRRVVRSDQDVDVLVARVGLSGETHKPIGALSGGQFQRLLVALALLGAPDVLLLDEFTSGVDVPGQQRLTELVHSLRTEYGLTVLAISHDLSVVYRSATNVLCMSRDHPCLGPPRKVLTPERLEEIYGAPVEFHVHGT